MAARTGSFAALLAFPFALFAVGAAPPAHADHVPLSDVVQLASGDEHSCAIVGGGAVKCWGSNWDGALGDGTTTDRTTPVDVVGLSGGVTALAVSTWHSCALTVQGGVKCWGTNGSGQLGDGTRTRRLTPVDVSGLDGSAKAIAAGGAHTCAAMTNGTVQCWGANSSGQLGNGSTQGSSIPVTALKLANVQAVAAGSSHTCALLDMGAVTCWGSNAYGQLGDGVTASQRLSPWPIVAGLDAGVRAIDSKYLHACVAMIDGSVRCWGLNGGGQLGDGTTSTRTTPVDVVGLAEPTLAVSTGGSHSCALGVSGGTRCWGGNFDGTLGDGGSQDSLVPVDVVGLPASTQVSAGYRHTCATTPTGGAACWGNDLHGQLGNATATQRLTPVDVVDMDATAVSVGALHACALTAEATVVCWGDNHYGQLGDGSTIRRLVPTPVSNLAPGMRTVSSGRHHSCAIDAAGRVECWGGNEYGQLGDGSGANQTAPVRISGLGKDNSTVVAGPYHTCAITAGGGAKCWGANDSGQLGDGSTVERDTPVDVVGLATGVRAIALGPNHTCALLENGGMKCWGDNWSGELGSGDGATMHPTPVDVAGLTGGVWMISATFDSTCAVTDAGAAKCWGYGILGDGNPAGIASTPVDVAGLSSGVVAITQGWRHTCAQLAGDVRCWGYNPLGQVGDGSLEDRLVPTSVVGMDEPLQAISAGGQSACALTAQDRLKCWGSNSAGQLGDGTFEGIPLPQTVLVPGDSVFRDGFD